MGYIYKITNLDNGKMYIGKTELIDPRKRWETHCIDYKRTTNMNRPLYSSMRKHGIDKFSFEVIDQELDSQKLCELEKFYIQKFRTYVGFEDCNGYNATLGGDGKPNVILDEDEVIFYHINNGFMIGRTAKKFKVDPESIKKILVKNNIKWLNIQEAKNLMYKEKYGGVVLLKEDANSNLFIYKIFDCVDDAYKFLGYRKIAMTRALSGREQYKNHKYKGYFWYRLNELPEKYRYLLNKYLIE